jgi:hypothetical protein
MTADLVDGLMQRIKGGGADAQAAGLALGLLVERVRMPDTAQQDREIEGALGVDWVGRHLSAADVEHAVTVLLDYLRETPKPLVIALWALGKAYAERSVDPLLAFLDRALADHGQDNAAAQAIGALVTAMPDADDYAPALAMLQRAVAQGGPEARLAAGRYLRLEPEP